MNTFLVPKTFDCLLLEPVDKEFHDKIYAPLLADLTRSADWHVEEIRASTRTVTRNIKCKRICSRAGPTQSPCMVIVTNDKEYASAACAI